MAKKTASSSVDFSAAIANSMANNVPTVPIAPPAPPPVPNLSGKPQLPLSGVEANKVLQKLNITPDQLTGAIAEVAASNPSLAPVAAPPATPTVAAKAQTAVDLRGPAKFSERRKPESFQQLAESPDGSIALLLETRNYDFNKKSGTSNKLVIRTKYIDQKTGEKMYGYDYGSIPNEMNVFLSVVDLLSAFAATLRK